MRRVNRLGPRQKRWAIIIGLAAVSILILGIGAWWAKAQMQPSEIAGNTSQEYLPPTTTQAATTATAKTSMSWPTYGYDAARSHGNPALTHRPPFAERWIFRSGNLLEFPPVVAEGRMFVGQLKGRFYAVDTETGKTIWDHQTDHCSAASPAYSEGVVYAAFLAPVPCPKGEQGTQGFVAAWDAASGKELWRRQLAPVESSPLVMNGIVYVGTWDHFVYALDAKTGKVRWQVETDGQIVSSAAWVDAEQAGGAPAIVIGTNGGSLYALDAASGKIRWQARSTDRLGSGREYFYATPTVAYGRVFIGNTDGWLYAYGAKSGTLLWAKSAGTYVYTAAVAADNVIYVGTYDGYIVAFDAGTGAETWRASVPGAVHGAPTLMAGLLYFSTCARCGQNGIREAKAGPSRTYAIDIATHKIVWSHPDGEYSPVVADENLVYLVGKGVIRGMAPSG